MSALDILSGHFFFISDTLLCMSLWSYSVSLYLSHFYCWCSAFICSLPQVQENPLSNMFVVFEESHRGIKKKLYLFTVIPRLFCVYSTESRNLSQTHPFPWILIKFDNFIGLFTNHWFFSHVKCIVSFFPSTLGMCSIACIRNLKRCHCKGIVLFEARCGNVFLPGTWAVGRFRGKRI